MIRVFNILIFTLLISVSSAFAQTDVVSEALRSYRSQNLDTAKILIDQAIEDSVYQSQARTWYYRGYIYKDLYKADRQSPMGTTHRLESIAAFRTAITLDKEKQFFEDSKSSLRFLASTLYNSAALALDTFNFEVALPNYNLYRELMMECDPGLDFTGRDIEYKLYLASRYSVLYEDTTITVKDTQLGEKIRQLYREVLALDSNNVSANYNLGIHYYNRAVFIIENIDFDLPFDELFRVQEECVEIFKQSLPYMLKAHELDPCRKEVLIGLSGIYFSLNEIEKSEYYKKLLEECENKNGGTEGGGE